MKWLLSVTALLVLATGAFGAALVEPQLQSILAAEDDDAYIPVTIVLNNQFDNPTLMAMVEDLPRPVRRARVGRILSDFAEQEQADLLAYLRAEEAAGEVSGMVSLWIINAVGCGAKRSVIRELAERDDIATLSYSKVAADVADLDPGQFVAPDVTDAVQPNLVRINARGAWAQGYTGQGVVIGVVDTGVRYTHFDLRGHLWRAIDTLTIPKCGFNFASNQLNYGHPGPSSYDSVTPLDYYGHGTHCAGITSADGAYGNNIRDTMGVAPSAKVMSLPVDVYLHSPYPDTVLDANNWAAFQFAVRPVRPGRAPGPDTLNGADLMTYSIGLITSWMPRYAMWRVVEENVLAAGIVHMVAAGNENTSGIRTPGNCPPPWPHPANGTGHPTLGLGSVITVGATDNTDLKASFSSIGPSRVWPTLAPWNDYPAPTYLRDPDICAPGVNIYATSNSGDQMYTTMSGTSMATPSAAGCVALMLSKNPMLTPRKIDSILEMHGVVDLGLTGKDTIFGSGRINCSLAVAFTPLPNDVGVTRINAPTAGNYDSLATATPSAWVKNYLTDPVSFKVRMRIGTWYVDSAQVTALAGGDSIQLTFGQWTALERGVLAVKCSTELAFDGNPGNDKVEYPLTVIVHDASAGRITVPSGTVDSASTVTPTVIVHNSGTAVENITARLRIGAYNETATATAVPGGDSVELSFPQWQVALRGDQAPTCSTEMAGDVYPSNDKSTGAFFGRVHDVAAAEILAPSGRVNPSVAVTPLVLVRNTGTDPISCNVRLEISTGYAFTQTVNNIPAETDTVVEFATWLASPPGIWQTSALVTASGDMIAANNLFVDSVRVGDPVPPGWSEVTPSVPSSPSGRAVKDGGWLVYDPLSATFYAAKGYKTGDFYQYDPVAGAWLTKPSMPNGIEAKPPYKGAVGCADGLGNIYATKGNNTSGFWKYNTVDSTWTQLTDVPLGLSNKKVKGGTDLVYVDLGDSQYVYVLKGYKTEFYRYNTVSGAWYTLADAPAGAKPKYDKGSFLVLDEANRRLYAHKAKYSEMYAYSLDSAAWGGLTAGIPLANQQTGKNKKAKDGSDGVLLDGVLYALKGGNTGEFFTYDPATATWAEAPLVPEFGSTGKKKRVKAGGSLASDGEAVYALKGNKTLEFWVYTLGTGDAWRPAPQRNGVLAQRQDPRGFGITLRPNPLRSGLSTVGYSLPAAGPLCIRIYDVTGRELVTSSSIAGRSGAVSLDLRGLSAGIYLVRLEATGYVTTSKLVVER
ncbi:MAG: S8/S53 family peptidase [bacterium]